MSRVLAERQVFGEERERERERARARARARERARARGRARARARESEGERGRATVEPRSAFSSTNTQANSADDTAARCLAASTTASPTARQARIAFRIWMACLQPLPSRLGALPAGTDVFDRMASFITYLFRTMTERDYFDDGRAAHEPAAPPPQNYVLVTHGLLMRIFCMCSLTLEGRRAI